ncbi:hypothetical protein HY642_00750, partial [Candidatus Woesearchaeota archaeon]|nr:hypothetical protein [Candidatus Woesearchaeota archaeon]
MPAAKSEETRTTAVLAKQPCPQCKTENLTLTEAEANVPFFGKAFLFSMT